MSRPLKILFVEDHDDDVELISRALERAEFVLYKRQVTSLEELRHELAQNRWELILCDFSLPEFNGLDALQVARELAPDTPFIVVSSAIGEERAADLFIGGAKDFISKNNLARLVPAVNRELADAQKVEQLRTVRQKLGETELSFSLLADSVRDYAIFFINREGLISNWNKGAQSLFGYTEHEVLGESFALFFTPTEQAPNAAQYILRQALKEGQFEDERWVHRRGGSQFWATSFLTAIWSPEGELRGFAFLIRDNTQKKRAAEEIESARLRAESASRAKTQFLANMSHEIRTPLGVMLGFAELMTDPDQSEEDRALFAGTILRNGRQLSRIIDEILDVSKVEANRLEIDKTRILLGDLIEGVVSLMRFQAVEKGLQLELEISPSVPAEIETDSVRLRQILLNLLGNAIKFTETGHVYLRVSLFQKNPTPSLLFEVGDTGKGISLEEQSRLFQPFSQGDPSTTRNYGGTGLGLYLSQQLAQAMGGELVLSSTQPGKGSVFQFRLPL